MTVAYLFLFPSDGYLFQYGFIPADDCRIVHHLAEAEYVRLIQQFFYIIDGNRAAGVFKVGSRHAGRNHKIDGNKRLVRTGKHRLPRILQHIEDTVNARDVGNFVRVGNNGGSTAAERLPGKIPRGRHRGLNVQVRIDKSRTHELAG